MLSSRGRGLAARLFTPVARLLLRLGLGPDTVTVLGTLALVAAALWFLPRGSFVAGPLLIAACALTDSVDGLMARELERRGSVRAKDFGAFLDSTLDRFADAAIFVGLVLWFTTRGPDLLGVGLALACLVFGSVVPYARARAEGLAMTAAVGIAERADRLVLVLVGIFAVGLGAPAWVLTATLAVLAAASLVTVVQRVATVHRQATARLLAAGHDPLAPPPPAPGPPGQRLDTRGRGPFETSPGRGNRRSRARALRTGAAARRHRGDSAPR